MCLAVPGKVIETLESDGIKMARVSFGGMVKQVCVEYTPEAAPGDYVLVHVGFALSRIDQVEAERTYRLLEELGQLTELEDRGIE
jgi:hydrogenase expression/formation protein HypC